MMSDPLRVASGLAVVGLATFVVTLSLSVVAYPGGSWADRSANGFQLFVNYWCDLMRTTAVNGTPNAVAALLARFAFATLAVSLAAYWWVAASQLTSRWLAQSAVAAGTLSAVSVGLVAVFPYVATEASW